MITSLKKDTLSYQLGIRPAFQKLDFSHVPLTQVAARIVSYSGLSNVYPAGEKGVLYPTNEGPKGSPEQDAIIFYMLNHAVSIVRQRVHPLQPLDKYLPIVEAHARELSVRSTRMFFYLLLICTRESRHDHSGGAYKKQYAYPIQEFHSTLKPLGSSGSAQALKDKPPKAPLGEYTRFLCDAFYKGGYGSGFGGKAWGKIADVLNDFAHGRLTAELMMDTAFTLCHNNGPIFNKGMLFDQYGQDIYHILDVQRSGQIPQLVATGKLSATQKPLVQSLWSHCKSVLGDSFDGPVDYYKVEELGSLHKYPTQKAAQDAKAGKAGKPSSGSSSSFGIPKSNPAPFPSIPKVQDLSTTPASEKVEIFPGEFLKKVSVR